MSEEHIKGGFEKAVGRVKEAAGALVGDDRLKAEGKADQVKGGAHQVVGDVKDAARNLGAKLRGETVPVRERDPLDPTELP